LTQYYSLLVLDGSATGICIVDEIRRASPPGDHALF
jgi:hypothetical protein